MRWTAVFVLLFSCSSDPIPGDENPGDENPGDEADAGKSGELLDVSSVCLRGTSDAARLEAGQAVEFVVYPLGCFSTDCTIIHEAVCDVSDAGSGALELSAVFQIEARGDRLCGPDCSGAGFATCSSTAPLAAGDYTATLGNHSLEFSVPGTVPDGGLCSGRPPRN